eukprot:m.36525 g.36525  ORF g.36525 m.36525 type:complete len:103 (+) comp10021_c1_seq1:2096-2404(+)
MRILYLTFGLSPAVRWISVQKFWMQCQQHGCMQQEQLALPSNLPSTTWLAQFRTCQAPQQQNKHNAMPSCSACRWLMHESSLTSADCLIKTDLFYHLTLPSS